MAESKMSNLNAPYDKRYTEENYDIIVVGGGMSGICAALAAARHGAKTALVQDRSVLGGNASSEIRMHICGATANMEKPELAEGGILHELMLDNKRVNDNYNFSIWDAVLFNAAKKEKNLTLYLNTTMHNVIAEDRMVKSIECYQMTTERRLILSAKLFADCTGNGTLCAYAGANFFTGSEGKNTYNEPHAPEDSNNDRMGNTLLFKASNVGHPVKFIPPVEVMHFTEEQLKYRKHTSFMPKEVLENASESVIRTTYDGYCQDYGYWWIEIQGNDGDIISEYENIRDQLVSAVYGVWNHIKNDGDHGADNYELVWVGMLPGVRESRRIETDYILNENDILNNHRFEDVVAYGGWNIDNHTPGGLFAYDKVASTIYPFEGSYDIPYRSYCVRAFDNLYVGGRCLGASKLAMASSRVMGTCAVGGQAIGTAAALCIKQNVGIRDINIKELQQTLLCDDCYLPNIKNTDEVDLARKATITASSQKENYPPENVISGITRRIDGESNEWRSYGVSANGEWISVKFDKSETISLVQVVFDSNFDLEKKITLSSRRQSQQEAGVPKELVRDYDIELYQNGKEVLKKEIRGNHQRLCRIDFTKTVCDEIRIVVYKTNGTPDARIFEIRVY